MQDKSWLIDDAGDTFAANSAAISSRLGVKATAATASYAVENIGWISVVSRPAGIHVRLRPSIVSEIAIAALFYWLCDRPSSRMSISWLENDAWSMEHAGNTAAAIAFLSLMLERGPRTAVPSASIVRHATSAKARRRWSEVGDVVSGCAQGGVISARLRDVLDRAFAGRWFINNVSAVGGDILVEARGDGYPPLDPAFTSRADRFTLDVIGDPVYRRWVDQSLRAVAKSGRPSFDDVDAVIDWPRIGPLRTRYWRVLVPLWRRTDNVFVLAASGNDSGIDLGPQLVEETSDRQGRVVGGHP